MRLSKVLARLGVASRRKVEEMIGAGRIAIDGETVCDLFASFDPDMQSLLVDGKPISVGSQRAYFLFNKPIDCLCTHRIGGRRIFDFFKDLPLRLFTVGRLDKETSGLIIVTNDGEFAHRIMHPRFGIPKEYEVVAEVPISDDQLQQLKKGALLDKDLVKPLSVMRIDALTVRIVVGEGKNREIRRLMSACGHRVCKLTRLRIGQLFLNQLPIGARQAMSEKEKKLAMTAHPELIKRSLQLSRTQEIIKSV